MSKLVVTDEQRAIGEEIIGRYFVELGVHKQKDIQDSIATAIAKAVEEERLACEKAISSKDPLETKTYAWESPFYEDSMADLADAIHRDMVKAIQQRRKRDE